MVREGERKEGGGNGEEVVSTLYLPLTIVISSPPHFIPSPHIVVQLCTAIYTAGMSRKSR